MTIEELIEQGQTALKQNDLPAAREAFDAAIEQEETNAPAWHGLGLVLLREGELDQALECFEYAAGENENLTPPWTALGHLAASLDEEQRAALFYKNAIQHNAQDPDPWNGLGILYAGKLGKPQEAVRCFLRAEHLGGGRHINNTVLLFSQLPPYPFFSYRIIRDYMPPAAYPKWAEFRKVTLEEALPLRAWLDWQSLKIANGQPAPDKWEMWQGIIHFLMGDPATALTYLDKAQSEKTETDLMIAYYQIQCAFDFVQAEAPYLEAALSVAEKYVPKVKSSGWGPFAKKKIEASPLSPAEREACYYAGLIFVENDDLKKALLCFERLEAEFPSAAYQALWLTEELVLPKKKKEKAEALLAREAEGRMFTDGISVFPLAADVDAFLRHLTYVNRYLELADAIDILHYHADFEGNPHDFEILMGKDQRPFYLLWEWTDEDRNRMIADLQSFFHQHVETTLAEPLAGLNAAGHPSLETALAAAIGSNRLTADTTPLITAYFQYREKLEARSRRLLDLYAQRPVETAEEQADEESAAAKAPDTRLLFLLDALTQPEGLNLAGELAEHFAAWRAATETTPTDFHAFREQLEAFIRDRPAPEPEEDPVVMEEIRSEEE